MQLLAIRIYLSNISVAWPIERQEALLDERLLGWRTLTAFRDVLDARLRQGHSAANLVERAMLLRPTSRARRETIAVAAAPCFAWDGADFDQAMAALADRRAILRDLSAGQDFGPDDIAAAREAFRAGRQRAKHEALQRAGVMVSAAKRRAEKDAGIERIRERWGMPSEVWPTAVLLAEAGASRNTVNDRLGTREEAQRKYQIKLKRQMRKAQTDD